VLPLTRTRKAVALLGLGGVLGVAAVVLALAPRSASPVSPGTGQDPSGAAVAQTEPYARGKALFVNKGCSTCHNHAVTNSEVPGTGMAYSVGAPDLTEHAPRLDSAYLHQWLTDPASFRPSTVMPDLDLTQNEIDDLVAFLQPRDSRPPQADSLR